MLGEHDRYFAARKMTEVDFGESELHVVRGDRDVAAGYHCESAAEYPTVDFRDHRLRHFAQDFIAPLAGFLTHFVAHAFRLRVHLDKILLQVLAGAKALARPGNDDHPRVLVVTQ